MTCSDGLPVLDQHMICLAHSSATSIRTGPRRARSQRGDEDSRWNCSATPARTAFASRSTTAPSKAAPVPRVVEPYSLRRTSDGHIVLFVINDRRQLRSYRVDRIAGIKPTTQTFTPVRRVEF
jgi:hypothetical protein